MIKLKYGEFENWNKFKVGTNLLIQHRICIVARCKGCKNKFLKSNKRHKGRTGNLAVKIRRSNSIFCTAECRKRFANKIKYNKNK